MYIIVKDMIEKKVSQKVALSIMTNPGVIKSI